VNCELNSGVIDSFSKQIPHPSRSWVNDTLIAAVGIFDMKILVAAVTEAIYIVVGKPNTRI
jgi:hypothetical protein